MESRKTVHLRPLIAMSTLAKLRPLFKIRKQQTCFLRRHGSRGFFSVPIQVLAETNKIWKDVKKQQNSITICCASIFFFFKISSKVPFRYPLMGVLNCEGKHLRFRYKNSRIFIFEIIQGMTSNRQNKWTENDVNGSILFKRQNMHISFPFPPPPARRPRDFINVNKNV